MKDERYRNVPLGNLAIYEEEEEEEEDKGEARRYIEHTNTLAATDASTACSIP